MLKSKYEQPGPEKIREKVIENGAVKINRLISNETEKFRITDRVRGKLKNLSQKLSFKCTIEINSSDILKKALEILSQENGGVFPSEELKQEYMNLLAQEIAQMVNEQGKELYQILAEKGVELNKRGVEIDGGKLGEKVNFFLNK
ncbi:hypothetical protein IID20_02515 [Patescibacteria group bacterium]|nr:hypothetical protein [Patescibacteria group bacterium]